MARLARTTGMLLLLGAHSLSVACGGDSSGSEDDTQDMPAEDEGPAAGSQGVRLPENQDLKGEPASAASQNSPNAAAATASNGDPTGFRSH